MGEDLPKLVFGGIAIAFISFCVITVMWKILLVLILILAVLIGLFFLYRGSTLKKKIDTMMKQYRSNEKEAQEIYYGWIKLGFWFSVIGILALTAFVLNLVSNSDTNVFISTILIETIVFYVVYTFIIPAFSPTEK